MIKNDRPTGKFSWFPIFSFSLCIIGISNTCVTPRCHPCSIKMTSSFNESLGNPLGIRLSWREGGEAKGCQIFLPIFHLTHKSEGKAEMGQSLWVHFCLNLAKNMFPSIFSGGGTDYPFSYPLHPSITVGKVT